MDAEMLKKRRTTALQAIKNLYGTPEGEHGPTLFVSHHLNELEPAYWLRTCGVEQPDADQILSSLALVDSWSSAESENIDTFDFTLPDNVSNYLLSVRFRDNGEVQYVVMES